MPEYVSWKESLGGNASGWSIKYYKVCMFKITGGINLGYSVFLYVLSVLVFYYLHYYFSLGLYLSLQVFIEENYFGFLGELCQIHNYCGYMQCCCVYALLLLICNAAAMEVHIL